MIEPCECFADNHYKVKLLCDLEENMTENILKALSHSLVCTEIDYLIVNLNNHSWVPDFDAALFGKLDVRTVHIYNASKIHGNIESGAFNSSLHLNEFIMEPSLTSGAGYVAGQTFTKLNHLKTVSLGNNFAQLKSSSFANLTMLTSLQFSQDSLTHIEEEAISFLRSLKQLDLSHQQLERLPKNAISHCPNLTTVDLSSNSLTEVHQEALTDLRSINLLDLSNNQLTHVGGILQSLDHQDIVVDLSDNGIKYLTEDQFKPFVEKRRNGYIKLDNNPLDCRCDVQWLLSSNLVWSDLFQNATCAIGGELQEVDGFLLTKMCPSKFCPRYDDLVSRYKPKTTVPVPTALENGLLITSSGSYSYELPPSQVSLFLVGGGGYGDKGNVAGSSGFFLSEVISLTGNQSFDVTIGGGGTSGSVNGDPTTVVVDQRVFSAEGGAGNGGDGWSGGGDDGGDGGSNGSSGTKGGRSMGNGQIIPLPSWPDLSPGAGGSPYNREGGGGGGVVIQGRKPTRRHTIDGEGFGAGGGEWDSKGYPGAVFIKVHKN